MNLKLTTLSLTCALALAACGGDNNPPPAQTPANTPDATDPMATQPPAMPPAAPDPTLDGTAGTGTAEGAGTTTGAPDTAGTDPATGAAGAAPGGDKPAAVVSNCSTTIEGNDAMQFNVGSITVPASCSEFTINLQHTGRLPVAAMGHNVVISEGSARQAIASEGVSAGLDGGYLKEGDERVIAATEMIGGGESTSVTFPVSALQGGGPYEFFCSFPGHWTVMRGSIQVG